MKEVAIFRPRCHILSLLFQIPLVSPLQPHVGTNGAVRQGAGRGLLEDSEPAEMALDVI